MSELSNKKQHPMLNSAQFKALADLEPTSRILSHGDRWRAKKRLSRHRSFFDAGSNPKPQHTIGVVFPDRHLPGNVALWEAIRERIVLEGDLSLIFDFNGVTECLTESLGPEGGAVDGILLIGSSKVYRGQAPAVVCVDPRAPFGDADVAIDLERSVESALIHLRSLGHTEIAVVLDDDSIFLTERGRFALFAASKVAGCRAVLPIGLECVGTVPCSAILCSDDRTASRVISIASTYCRECPRDISVMSCGGPVEGLPFPGITSMRNPWKDLGSLAVQKLINRMKPSSPPMPSTILLHAQAVEAGSTAQRSHAAQFSSFPGAPIFSPYASVAG